MKAVLTAKSFRLRFDCTNASSAWAWFMGSSDLKLMSAGSMDPTGKGLTQAGMILGIIGSIGILIGLFFVVLWLIALVGFSVAA